jgi:DNA-binding NarL/FixJ family response regulator
MVSRGKSNRQIAHELQISETTVKSELRIVYAALGVSSRAEAVGAALRTGLVD